MNRPDATRHAAIERLRSFLPDAGKYAKSRNFDLGPYHHPNVSMLSAYLRTRLITEQEVALSVLERFSPSTVDKFLQEVAWRTYWKGWLEMRPEVWTTYRRELQALGTDDSYEQAVSGRTGIECFDVWAQELVESGYLHNHARMWFASIWVFTLRLPWQLGADFFFRHLLDGDPASNTLSWRWVAGLHTKGKHYLARASNIEKFTNGRFNPVGQLNESAEPLPPDHEFERRELELPGPPAGNRLGRLLVTDDLAPLDHESVVATAGWLPAGPGPLGNVSPTVYDFQHRALDDALEREQGERLTGELGAAIDSWAAREGLDGVLLVRPTVGPWRDLFAGIDTQTPIQHWVREWDRELWPHATAGYFKLKKKLPAFFKQLSSGKKRGLLQPLE